MPNQFHTLFSVRFTHDYFGDAGFRGFGFSPDRATANDLLRLGLIMKTQPNGFTVSYESVFAGSPRTREEVLNQSLSLIFTITNNDTEFYMYTDGLEGEISIDKSLFYFTNDPGDKGEYRNLLTESENVSTAEMVSVHDHPEKFFSKPFGQVKIKLTAALPEQFIINFRAKETHWRYLLVSAHLKELISPAVVNKDTGEIFIGPEPIDLPDSSRALAFRSVNPVRLTAKPNKSFQLVENYESQTGRYRVVKSTLPNPIAGAITALPVLNDEKLIFSEIFL